MLEHGKIHLHPLFIVAFVEHRELVTVLHDPEVDPSEQVALHVPRQQTPKVVHQIPPFGHVNRRQVLFVDVDQGREQLRQARLGVSRGPLYEVAVHRRERVAVLLP